jgi:KTSC domain
MGAARPSTAIADIEYDPERARLTVTFVSGRVYDYDGVPLDVVADFQSAESKGVFFQRTHPRSISVSGNHVS